MSDERITWKRVWPLVAPWRWQLAGAAVTVLVGAGLSLLPPLILRSLIDNHLAIARVEGIALLALAYLGATMSVHVTSFLTAYATTVAAQGALKRLRVQLFIHLQKLPISYYDHSSIGDAISRCTSDMETIDRLFSSGVISLLAESFRLVVTLGAMIALSLPLSLTLIAALPVLVLITRRFQRLMRDAQRTLRKATGSLNGRIQENLTRVDVIKTLNWEFRIIQRFRKVLAGTLEAQNKSIAYGAVYDPLLKIFQTGLVAVFLTASASPFLETFNISIGTLTAFILLFDQFFGPLIRIGNEWQVVQGALAGLERVVQVLSLPVDGEDCPEEAPVIEPARSTDAIVEVNSVTFGYEVGEPVLREVNLRVDAGSHVAIVGRTGARKSSLFHLLGGLYRPWEGHIRILGNSPHVILPEDRRGILGTVPQSGWMFSGTVAENLSMWDDTVSQAAIEKAGRISGADAFVSKLPNGYDTLVNEMGRGAGVQLSAGERQILALARALIGDPPILLFDEATAAVDAATESSFKRALRSHIKDRRGAVITIAHRLSTAMEADRLVVMDQGRIVEEGTPEELLSLDGQFAALWVLENAGWDWREGGRPAGL